MLRTALLAGLAATLAATTMAAASTSTTPVAAAPAVTVGTDALGDWGGGGDAAAVGHALGQDLLSATVASSGSTIDFVLGVSFLPSPGGVPEASRYTWNFVVEKKSFELDGKFTNYSRGACDPTSGQCPPPRDPGPAPFLLRGDCTAGEGNVTLCKELGRVSAAFDAAARTITVKVPAGLLGVAPCSRITGGTNLFGGSVSAVPSAFFSSSLMPLDTLDVKTTFRLPSADPAVPCA